MIYPTQSLAAVSSAQTARRAFFFVLLLLFLVSAAALTGERLTRSQPVAWLRTA